MKIIELRAENFKRLVVANIRPDGNMVQLTGKNRQGKSSVLDALWAAFAGKDACPSVPIRQGAEEAMIRVDCGDLIVTRHFRHAKEGSDFTTRITVENKDGARYGSPQEVLDRLLGELSFDPLEFARMKPKDQFEALRRFVPDVDFEQIARADLGDRERRTDVGRLARQERAAAQAIIVPKDTPQEGVDEAALVVELENAGTSNQEIEQRRANRQRAADRLASLKVSADQLAERAKDLLRQMQEAEADAKIIAQEASELEQKIAAAPPLPDPIETAEIRRRIEAARETNASVRKLEDRRKRETEASRLEGEIEVLTAKIDARQAEKANTIAAAKMPIDGLTLDSAGDCVLFNTLPFAQASDAEQLRVSVAIAMALNPKLRVVRIRDGSLLDEDAMQLLGEMADQYDVQVWIERVDSSGKVGFVLEDGHVRQAGKPRKTPNTPAPGHINERVRKPGQRCPICGDSSCPTPEWAEITFDQATVIADHLREDKIEASLFLAQFEINDVGQLPAKSYPDALLWIETQVKARE
jgi:hypothetical protein